MEARPDRFTAFVDANVLVPVLWRNLLLSLAEAGLFRLRFSAAVLAEVERAIPRANPRIDAVTAAKQVGRIRSAFPEAIVEDYDHVAPMFFDMPDPDDRHIACAAFKCDAAVIVTENLKDFPIHLLAPCDIETLGPDDFIADIIDIDRAHACAAVRTMRERFRRPDVDPDGLVQRCHERGLPTTAGLLSGNLDRSDLGVQPRH